MVDLIKKTNGTVSKVKSGYSITFYIESKRFFLGIYKRKKLAEEVRNYFVSINYNIDEFKKSKYWLDLRNQRGKIYSKGCIRRYENEYASGWYVVFSLNSKMTYIGAYNSYELAEEVRKYFIFINYDLAKFKQSNYWLNLRRKSKRGIKND